MNYFSQRQLLTNPVNSFALKYNALRASGLQDE